MLKISCQAPPYSSQTTSANNTTGKMNVISNEVHPYNVGRNEERTISLRQMKRHCSRNKSPQVTPSADSSMVSTPNHLHIVAANTLIYTTKLICDPPPQIHPAVENSYYLYFFNRYDPVKYDMMVCPVS